MKKKELIIATTNQGKLREIKELLMDLNLNITSLKDYPNAPEIIEDGQTFAQNAFKKASIISAYTKKMTIGEDSGLEIEALGNEPGIYSARFSGPNATDAKNNQKMLRSLRGLPSKERGARYRCAVSIVDDSQEMASVSGVCSGVITGKARGANGFGYDPYFLIARYQQTFGELDPCVKARISHRARAFKKVKKVLIDYFQ